MALPASPNRTTPPSLKRDSQGWPVYALQTALNGAGYDLADDGDFGPATEDAVRVFQRASGVIADGVAGGGTQVRLVAFIDERTHERHPLLPTGLLRGFAEAEGGNNLGAVNWSVPGGVDCGVVQVRCYGPPYDAAAMREAYDPLTAMERVALDFQRQVRLFAAKDYARTRARFAQRCAALAWNWPWAADQYARNGRLPEPGRDATWAVIGGNRVRFPDGSPVMTWSDWAQFYALGGPHGEGRMTRFVVW